MNHVHMSKHVLIENISSKRPVVWFIKPQIYHENYGHNLGNVSAPEAWILWICYSKYVSQNMDEFSNIW